MYHPMMNSKHLNCTLEYRLIRLVYGDTVVPSAMQVIRLRIQPDGKREKTGQIRAVSQDSREVTATVQVALSMTLTTSRIVGVLLHTVMAYLPGTVGLMALPLITQTTIGFTELQSCIREENM